MTNLTPELDCPLCSPPQQNEQRPYNNLCDYHLQEQLQKQAEDPNPSHHKIWAFRLTRSAHTLQDTLDQLDQH